jgi:hypothetical protein
MEYKARLERLKEGVVNDYLAFQGIKQMFNVPNITFYQYGLLKKVIEDFFRQKGIK